MPSQRLLLFTLSTDSLATIVSFLTSSDIALLCISGDSRLHRQLAAHGVVQHLRLFPANLSCVSRFRHLLTLTIAPPHISRLYGTTPHRHVNLDFRQLPPTLTKLTLYTPGVFAAMVECSLRDLLPNLLTLALGHQYTPRCPLVELFASLPPLTTLVLPSNQLLLPRKVECLPKTLTSLHFALESRVGYEEEARKALNLFHALKDLKMWCAQIIRWTSVVPSTIVKLKIMLLFGNMMQRERNDPLNCGFLERRYDGSDAWVPSPDDLANDLPQHLQSFVLMDRVSESFTAAHFARLPRTLTKLKIANYRTYNYATKSDPALLLALPPKLTTLHTNSYIISTPEAWAMRPPSLTQWRNLILAPTDKNFVYPLPPAMRQLPIFRPLISEQVALFPPGLKEFEQRLPESFAKQGASTLSSLTRLDIHANLTDLPDSANVTLIKQLPTFLRGLTIIGDLPSCLAADDWQSLKTMPVLVNLTLPLKSYPSISPYLPDSIQSLTLSGDFGDSWQPNWPPRLRDLAVRVGLDCTPFASAPGQAFWTTLPSSISSLVCSANSFVSLPTDWKCLPQNLRILDLQSYLRASKQDEVVVRDEHLHNLPADLQVLSFSGFQHDLTMSGIRALPRGLRYWIVGKWTSADSGSPGLDCFFNRTVTDHILLEDELAALGEVLKDVPSKLTIGQGSHLSGLAHLIQRRQFEVLRQECGNVTFVVPGQWNS